MEKTGKKGERREKKKKGKKTLADCAIKERSPFSLPLSSFCPEGYHKSGWPPCTDGEKEPAVRSKQCDSSRDVQMISV
jgi:hypothetical protein